MKAIQPEAAIMVQTRGSPSAKVAANAAAHVVCPDGNEKVVRSRRPPDGRGRSETTFSIVDPTAPKPTAAVSAIAIRHRCRHRWMINAAPVTSAAPRELPTNARAFAIMRLGAHWCDAISDCQPASGPTGKPPACRITNAAKITAKTPKIPGAKRRGGESDTPTVFGRASSPVIVSPKIRE
jgi:hypothetical protein